MSRALLRECVCDAAEAEAEAEAEIEKHSAAMWRGRRLESRGLRPTRRIVHLCPVAASCRCVRTHLNSSRAGRYECSAVEWRRVERHCDGALGDRRGEERSAAASADERTVRATERRETRDEAAALRVALNAAWRGGPFAGPLGAQVGSSGGVRSRPLGANELRQRRADAKPHTRPLPLLRSPPPPSASFATSSQTRPPSLLSSRSRRVRLLIARRRQMYSILYRYTYEYE